MTARPNRLPLLRRLGFILPVVVAAILIAAWTGCATPQERYRTLSFFFDGVPNPNTPKPTTKPADDANASAGGQVVTLSIVSRHKPFVERQCAACHTSASGNIMEFEEAYKVCTRCHKNITTEYPRMHGPVAAATVAGPVPTCKWCHTPHESPEPALLKDTAAKVCTQCHEAQLLGPNPQQHRDGTSCIQCHFGHGGASGNTHFLKPAPAPPSTGTQPATCPAAMPATRPATQPAATTQPGAPIQGGVP